VRRSSARQTIRLGLGIVTASKRESTTAVFIGWTSRFLCTFPTGRKGYILHQCVTIAVIFLLAGRDTGQPAFSANPVPA